MATVNSRFTFALAGAGLLMLLVTGTVALTALRHESAPVLGRTLAADDMRATFGDGNCAPCQKNFRCETPFVSGASDSAFCDSASPREMCCNLGKDTACYYEPGGTACKGFDHYKGPRSGQPGTCGTCSGSMTKQPEKCTGFNEVDDNRSDNCPAE